MITLMQGDCLEMMKEIPDGKDMNMSNGEPAIKLEIEGMKHAILHHFADHNKRVETAVEGEIDNIVASLDIAGIVREELSKAVEEAVRFHFSCGTGRQIIHDCVTEFLVPKKAR